MMSSAVWTASYPIALPRYARSMVWRRPVRLPRIVVVSSEWSIGLVMHYSHLSIFLVGHDCAACPHILQAIMAQVSGASKHVAASLLTSDGRSGLEPLVMW
jgi:hypothetical protein